jgi:hypothetical protein
MDRRTYLCEGGPSPSVSRSSEKGGFRAFPIEAGGRSGVRRVGVWRGGFRLSMSVAAPFVGRCLSGSSRGSVSTSPSSVSRQCGVPYMRRNVRSRAAIYRQCVFVDPSLGVGRRSRCAPGLDSRQNSEQTVLLENFACIVLVDQHGRQRDHRRDFLSVE